MANFKPYEKEINTSKAWYFQLAAYVLNTGTALKEQLALLLPKNESDVYSIFANNILVILISATVFGWLRFFKQLYSNYKGAEKERDYKINLGKSFVINLALLAFTILTAVGAAGAVLANLGIAALVYGWGRLIKQIYNHWGKAKDKDYWINFSISLLSNLAMTAFMVLTAVGIGAGGALFINLVLYAAPWVLAAAIGVNALYCLGKAILHAYEGFNSENSAEVKSQHRWACLRQIFGIAVNALVLVLAVNLGILFGVASAKLLTGDWTVLTDIVNLYTSMQSVAWAALGTVVAALTLGWFKGPNPVAVVAGEGKEEGLIKSGSKPTVTSMTHAKSWAAGDKHTVDRTYSGCNRASITASIREPLLKAATVISSTAPQRHIEAGVTG